MITIASEISNVNIFWRLFMNSDKREDYYVGLDMGTGSLGGAVTDTQYHLLKVKGKDFWFVRGI